MPTYRDVIEWVARERRLKIHHMCGVAHCKAIALGHPKPELNNRGEPRIQPCPEGAPRRAMLDAFNAPGAPDGRRALGRGAPQ